MSRVNCEKGPARTRPMAKVSTGSNAGCPKRIARQEASMSGTCLCRSQAAGTGTPAEKRQQVIRPGRGGINRSSTPRLLRSAIRHRASKAVNQEVPASDGQTTQGVSQRHDLSKIQRAGRQNEARELGNEHRWLGQKSTCLKLCSLSPPASPAEKTNRVKTTS